MALIELRHGFCDTCGHGVMLQVYWPMATMLRRLVELGGLQEFDVADIEALLADAQAVDEHEQDVDGGLDPVFRSVGAGVFVDGRKEQAVTCPNCGALIGVVARQRVG